MKNVLRSGLVCLLATAAIPSAEAVPGFTAPVPVHFFAQGNVEPGGALAFAGDTLAVADIGGGMGVYVFVRTDGVWVETAKLTTRDAQVGGNAILGFGMSLAISPDGRTLFVGDPDAACKGDKTQRCGEVAFYQKPAGGWASTDTPSGRLRPSVTASQEIGMAIAVSSDGKTLAAQGDAVYVFVKPASGWASATQTAILGTASGNGGGGTSLEGVSVDGDVVAVNGVGLYVKPVSGWVDTTTATASLGGGGFDSQLGDFGSSLKVIGDKVLVGAHAIDKALLYQQPGGGWVSTSSPTASLQSPSAGVSVGDGINMIGTTAVTGDGAFLYFYDQPGGGWASETPNSSILLSFDPGLLPFVQRFVIAVSGNELATTTASDCTFGVLPCTAAYVLSTGPAGTDYDGLILDSLTVDDQTRQSVRVNYGYTGDVLSFNFDVANLEAPASGTATLEITTDNGKLLGATALGRDCTVTGAKLECPINLSPDLSATVQVTDLAPGDQTTTTVTATLKDISPVSWDALDGKYSQTLNLRIAPAVPPTTTVSVVPGQAFHGVLPHQYIGTAPLSFKIVTSNVMGLSLNPGTGAYVWTPPSNFAGDLSLTYQVSDGTVSSGIGTLDFKPKTSGGGSGSGGGGSDDLLLMGLLTALLGWKKRRAQQDDLGE